MNKTEKALKTCENILDGIGDDTITTSSALLQCLKVARLLNDQTVIIWLQYEYGGYPRTKDGHILNEAWQIGYDNGRGYMQDENNAFL